MKVPWKHFKKRQSLSHARSPCVKYRQHSRSFDWSSWREAKLIVSEHYIQYRENALSTYFDLGFIHFKLRWLQINRWREKSKVLYINSFYLLLCTKTVNTTNQFSGTSRLWEQRKTWWYHHFKTFKRLLPNNMNFGQCQKWFCKIMDYTNFILLIFLTAHKIQNCSLFQ